MQSIAAVGNLGLDTRLEGEGHGPALPPLSELTYGSGGGEGGVRGGGGGGGGWVGG